MFEPCDLTVIIDSKHLRDELISQVSFCRGEIRTDAMFNQLRAKIASLFAH